LFIHTAAGTAGPIGSSGLITNGTPVTGGVAGNVLYTDGSKLQAYAAVPLSIIGSTSAAATITGNTMLGNWANATGPITALSMPPCADSGGNHLNYVGNVGITCGTSTGTGAGLPVFNVANFANVALAFAAAATNGGIVFFPENFGTPYTISSQTIATGITVQCANKNSVQLQAGSTTGPIFNVSGAHVVIQDCGFTSASTPGTSQTASEFINVSGDDFSMISNVMNGPYVGVNFASGASIAHIVDLTVYNITQRTTATGGSAIRCAAGGDVHVSQLTIGANGAGQTNWPSYGIEVPNCTITIDDSALLNANVGLMIDPGTGQVSFVKATNTWMDTDGAYGAFVCPTSTGVVGGVTIASSHFGPSGGVGISFSTSSANSCAGSILYGSVVGSNFVNYTNGAGHGVEVWGGSTSEIALSGNIIGEPAAAFLAAIDVENSGNSLNAIGNHLCAYTSSACNGVAIYAAAGTASIAQLNSLNGGSVTAGSNTHITNNY
jgi:hypothetical protein